MFAPLRLRRSRSIFARVPEEREIRSLSPVVRHSIQTAVRELDRRFSGVLPTTEGGVDSEIPDSGDEIPAPIALSDLLTETSNC